MKMRLMILMIAAVTLIGGCARPYRKINMSAVPFKDYHQSNKISYASRQGVLYNMKDFFYAKREMKHGLTLMAFKIANTSSTPIYINDLQFSCGASLPIAPVKMDEFYDILKQKSGLYWLYSVGVVVYPRPPKGSHKFIPLPFGLPVAAANYAIAYKANKKLHTDLQLLDLSNKVIQPGDTIQGLLPFRGIANCGDIFISVKE